MFVGSPNAAPRALLRRFLTSYPRVRSAGLPGPVLELDLSANVLTDPTAVAKLKAQMASVLGVAEADIVLSVVDGNSVDVAISTAGWSDAQKQAALAAAASAVTSGTAAWVQAAGVSEARMQGASGFAFASVV